MKKYDELATDGVITKTAAALKKNGINSIVVENGGAAKEKVLELIPAGAEVMDMTSVTLETIGLTKEIRESGRYDAVKNALIKMDRATSGREMQKLGAAPDWAIGSVHAVTQEGHIFIASNTGSQLAGYVYGAGHVVWVVSTKKIVTDDEDAKKRIYEHIVPLEEVHMQQLYGVSTFVSKLLTVNREVVPGRITIIFVKENLGF